MVWISRILLVRPSCLFFIILSLLQQFVKLLPILFSCPEHLPRPNLAFISILHLFRVRIIKTADFYLMALPAVESDVVSTLSNRHLLPCPNPPSGS